MPSRCRSAALHRMSRQGATGNVSGDLYGFLDSCWVITPPAAPRMALRNVVKTVPDDEGRDQDETEFCFVAEEPEREEPSKYAGAAS